MEAALCQVSANGELVGFLPGARNSVPESLSRPPLPSPCQNWLTATVPIPCRARDGEHRDWLRPIRVLFGAVLLCPAVGGVGGATEQYVQGLAVTPAGALGNGILQECSGRGARWLPPPPPPGWGHSGRLGDAEGEMVEVWRPVWRRGWHTRMVPKGA